MHKIAAIYISAILAAANCAGQLPEAAQVFLYFPHLADGGPPVQQWQTKLSFVNTNTVTVNVLVTFLADDGGPVRLDCGTGASNQFSFAIPANGSRVFRSRAASPATATGWAVAFTNLPVQGTVSFRAMANGVPQVEI